MIQTSLEIGVAPLLVAAASLSARRWGARAGGVVSALPAIVGPLLLLTAERHGAAFAARTAAGTLLGLVALSGFVVVYARAATVAGWAVSLAAGWLAAALIAGALSAVEPARGVSLAAAVLALGTAHRLLPARGRPAPAPRLPWWDVPLRMVLTVVLIVALAGAAGRFGAQAGGELAALPVLASILAVFTHRDDGPAALAALLRGMLEGMAAFVTFCALIALLIVPAGTAVAFTTATPAALAVAAVVGWRGVSR